MQETRMKMRTRKVSYGRRNRRNKEGGLFIFSLILVICLGLIFAKFFLPKMINDINGDKREIIEKKAEEFVWTENKDDNLETKKTNGDAKEDAASSSSKEEKEDKPAYQGANPGEFELTLSSSAGDLKYFNQTDTRWKNEIYGRTATIETDGCGPTVMATIVASLTDHKDMDPIKMSEWSNNNGFCYDGAGSSHELIASAANNFGLSCYPMYMASKEEIIDTLKQGKVIVMLSGNGVFSTGSGHFIIIRQLLEDGKVAISDSMRIKHVYQEWDIDTLIAESSNSATAGGPFWAIGK